MINDAEYEALALFGTSIEKKQEDVYQQTLLNYKYTQYTDVENRNDPKIFPIFLKL